MPAVDPHLAAAVHLSLHDRAAFDRAASDAPAHEHSAWQVSTIAALMDGRYDGDVTIGELLAHGDLGLGTLQHLDGELVVVDGEAWRASADGSVSAVDLDTRSPFAVVCRFRPGPARPLGALADLAELCAALDELSPAGAPATAVRIHGRFAEVDLRSVPRQTPPYRPLTEVVADQSAWVVRDVVGTIVGFRFPPTLGGIEVPGHHLHFLADDRSCAGHVTGCRTTSAVASIDVEGALHLAASPEVEAALTGASAPPQVAADDLRRVEGGA